MTSELYSILVGTAGLTVAAVISAFLAVARPLAPRMPAMERRLLLVAVLSLLLQAGHFTEELLTGFYVQFPELLGLQPWSRTFFVSFNLFWICVWGLSIVGVRVRLQVATFPIWFLGIGSVANGVAHPVFAMAVGGYFPGLYTSPFVGVAGILLLGRLAAITRSQDWQPPPVEDPGMI
ncbi:MAG: hypothetical protein WBW88_06740 [Rhodothermales bacterium]